MQTDGTVHLPVIAVLQDQILEATSDEGLIGTPRQKT